jgi:hypothetical protein
MNRSDTDLNRAWQVHTEAAAGNGKPGCVYTPRGLALRLAEAVLAPLPLSPAPSVLDPACGAGALLLGALEWALRERPTWISTWRSGGMRGWDTSQSAVDACNRALSLVVPGLRPAELRDGLQAEGSADAVLANPPWISFSGRHAIQIEPAKRSALRQRFAAFRGWPAMHAAFAERCAELTRQDGRCGMLLPMQVADLAGYDAARQAMTRRHRLECVTDLGESAFGGVTEPAGMFILSPRDDSEIEQDITPALPPHCRPLPPQSFGDIGVHTGNAAELLIAKSPEPGARPLRVGRDISPYNLKPPSLWLREVELPEDRYARVANDSRYREAVIVLRQTAARPIAARHEPWALFRNSVLACFGAAGHDPDFLLAVFNSEYVARLHTARFRDARQKAFPQLKLSHLRALPVPGREIGPLYERIANAARSAADDRTAAELASRLVEQAYAAQSVIRIPASNSRPG